MKNDFTIPDRIDFEEISQDRWQNKFKKFLKDKKKFIFISVLFFFLILISLPSYLKFKQGNIPYIKTTYIARGALINSISAEGVVIAKEQTVVSSKIGGIIKEIYVKDGDFVEKDELLLLLEDTQIQNQILNQDTALSLTRGNLQNAKIARGEAEKNLNTAEELFLAKAVAKEYVEIAKAQYQKAKIAYDTAYLQTKQAEANLSLTREQTQNTKIGAPAGGRISFQQSQILGLPATSGNLQVGNYIPPNTQLFTITDTSKLQIKGYVDEVNIKNVVIGQSAEVSSEMYPEKIFPGYVVKIGSTIVPQAGLPMVEVIINLQGEKDEQRDLKIGSNTDVEIITEYKKNAVLIPQSAIFEKDGEKYVYVVERKGESKVRLRGVTTGITSEDNVEILAGVKEGEEVVFGDIGTLKDGIKVK